MSVVYTVIRFYLIYVFMEKSQGQPAQPQSPQQQQFISPQQVVPVQSQSLVLNNQDVGLVGFPQVQAANPIGAGNGGCQQYFDKISAEEWLPRVLVPLTFDRASETKVGVFYARFKNDNFNNDHVIVRLIDSRKSNTTMYSIKLFRVGTVSISVSKLSADGSGDLQQNELRKESINNAVNITDDR